ncbi:MAG: SRPBCC family protein [Elusimicrobia bacterium]|nr:SRPBCC family protein [Elusimicrobiota bacterium]
MINILKIAGAAVALAVVVVLALAAGKPDEFRVERKVTIGAAPAKIFPWLEDPRRTVEWSPWEKKDPKLKKTFSGAAKGVGAVYEWDGNKDIGAGRLEIVEAEAPKKVVMDLHFLRPMEGRNVARYEVTPVAGGSEVAWSIEGPMPFVSKVMYVFFDMDKMIGAEFEKGLGDLKVLAEKP